MRVLFDYSEIVNKYSKIDIIDARKLLFKKIDFDVLLKPDQALASYVIMDANGCSIKLGNICFRVILFLIPVFDSVTHFFR